MSQKIRIKLKSYDHNLVDKSAEKIVKTVKATGAVVSGPIPLPTHKRIFTVNRSTFVNKKSREQFELSSFKRLIDIYSSTAKTVDALMKLELLSGAGAEEFAKEQGLEMVEDNMYFATPKTMEWIEKLKQESKKNGTVGCVVLDKQGNLTAGTSTGGMFKKRWGRIGDSPVIGAGTYADNNSCAVSCTGHGEYFIRHAVAFDVCARYKYLKESVEKAADYIIHTELNTNAGNGGLIAVDKLGNIAMPYNSGGMFRGFLYKEKGSPEIKKGCGIGKKIVVVGEK